MKKTLIKLTEPELEKYNRAIKLRSMTSWGISDPRSIAMIGDQEIIYKKISHCLNDKNGDTMKLIRCPLLENMMWPIEGTANPQIPPAIDGAGVPRPMWSPLVPPYTVSPRVNWLIQYTEINPMVRFAPFLVTTRHPMTLNELYTELGLTRELIDTLNYKFLPNVNNLSSDWLECNKAPKLHTSYKWLRIKPKTLFNHVLPISDTRGFCIHNNNTSQDLNMCIRTDNPMLDNPTTNIRAPATDFRYAREPQSYNAFEYSFNVNRPSIDFAAPNTHTMFYPKSSPIGLKLINHTHNQYMLDTTDCAITEGICASDLYAQNITDINKIRKIHVLSHIMYNDNTFGYVPLRQLMLLDIGYNFIRYKITQENLYTTQKIISGSLLYDSEYHNESVYEQAYGTKSNSSLINKASIVPRVKTVDNNNRPNIKTL